MLTSLMIANKRLKEDLRAQQQHNFQLQSDLDSLRSTIQDHLPFFNQCEEENKQLKQQLLVQQKRNEIKSNEKLSYRIRKLEEQLKTSQVSYERQLVKLNTELTQFKERCQNITKANLSLQKKAKQNQEKVDQYDQLSLKCKKLEEANFNLINLVQKIAPSQLSEQILSRIQD